MRFLGNERGDILVLSIMIAVVCGMASSIMAYQITQISANGKRARIKSMMAATEAKVRATLLSPVTYGGTCRSTDVVGNRQLATCDLPVGAISALSMGNIPGVVRCRPAAAVCGIQVTRVSWDFATSRAVVQIEYTGDDFNLQPILVDMVVPVDILQQQGIYECPPSKPQFLGLLANGQLNCVALPPRAPAGKFANRVDLEQMTVEVRDLPGLKSCPAGQIVKTVKWKDGGTGFDYTCADRPNAFDEFGFLPRDPSTGLGDVVIIPNRNY